MADTRAKKAGLGADIEKKMEAHYDQVEADGIPKHIQEWINEVLGEELNCKIEKYDQKSLHHGLMTGVTLCQLINKLLESEGKAKQHVQKKAHTMFVAYTNIESYNRGCIDYGLAKEFTVQSADLWEGRKGPFLNVINSLHSLGMLSKTKGFTPAYKYEALKIAGCD